MSKVKFFAAILLLTFIISVLGFAQSNKKPQEEKKYSCNIKLTKEEWTLVATAIASPDDVTTNQRKYIYTKLLEQINPQLIAADSVQKK